TATSGTPPYTWSIGVGSLPAGLTLNSSTGVISGTPTVTAVSSFTVTVTDATPKAASQSTSITVADPVVVDSTAPAGSVSIDGGAATNSNTLSLSLSASDAVGVVAYRVAEGSDCSSASWVGVASATSFSGATSLVVSSGDGTKTVCVQYKDA